MGQNYKNRPEAKDLSFFRQMKVCKNQAKFWHLPQHKNEAHILGGASWHPNPIVLCFGDIFASEFIDFVAAFGCVHYDMCRFAKVTLAT